MSATPANVTAFLEAAAGLEAPADAYIALLQGLAAQRYAMVVPLALLPSLIYLPWLLVQWLRRRAAAARGERLAASMTAARLDPEEQPMTDRGATKSQLAAANRAAAGVKLRVSGGLFQLGWALFFFEVFSGIIWPNIDGGGSMVTTGMRAVLGSESLHRCLMTIRDDDHAPCRSAGHGASDPCGLHRHVCPLLWLRALLHLLIRKASAHEMANDWNRQLRRIHLHDSRRGHPCEDPLLLVLLRVGARDAAARCAATGVDRNPHSLLCERAARDDLVLQARLDRSGVVQGDG